ncbi:hypothetical protein LTR87_016718, partial [Friedmanniomyces endolithicus]
MAPHPLSVATPTLSPSRRPYRGAPQSPSRSQTTGTGTGSSLGEKRKRTRSPGKKLDDQQYARYPVTVQPVVRISDLPSSVRPRVLAMRAIGKGQKIFHKRYASWKEEVGSGIEEEDTAMYTHGLEEGEQRNPLGSIGLEW